MEVVNIRWQTNSDGIPEWVELTTASGHTFRFYR